MDQPSHLIADRYQLELSSTWKAWFDLESHQIQLPGAFREPVDVPDLVSPAPRAIWAGFMLPDTLPVLCNGYGDWICVRVTEQNAFGELIHWYHGGGDWIPVGDTLQAAALHDWLDQHRPAKPQMLRGANETLGANHLARVAELVMQDDFRAWASSVAGFSSLEELFGVGSYATALDIMLRLGIAPYAVACDKVEYLLRTATLLDCGEREWREIVSLANAVIEKREDLAWAFDCKGILAERQGDREMAAATYFRGREASAFSNQSVRLGTFHQRLPLGKVSMGGLLDMQMENQLLSEEIGNDAYFKLFRDHAGDALQLQTSIRDYWDSLASEAESRGDYGAAYEHYIRAGWDVGTPKISDYAQLLAKLSLAARRAGWAARERVAEAHLSSLHSRGT